MTAVATMPSERRLQALEGRKQPRRLKGTCRAVTRHKSEHGMFAVLELVTAKGQARRVFIALPAQKGAEALKGLQSFIGHELSLDADRPDGVWRSEAASIASPPKPKYTIREQLRDEMRRSLPVGRRGSTRAAKPVRRHSLFD